MSTGVSGCSRWATCSPKAAVRQQPRQAGAALRSRSSPAAPHTPMAAPSRRVVVVLTVGHTGSTGLGWRPSQAARGLLRSLLGAPQVLRLVPADLLHQHWALVTCPLHKRRQWGRQGLECRAASGGACSQGSHNRAPPLRLAVRPLRAAEGTALLPLWPLSPLVTILGRLMVLLVGATPTLAQHQPLTASQGPTNWALGWPASGLRLGQHSRAPGSLCARHLLAPWA